MTTSPTAEFVPIPLPDFVERSPEEMQRRAEAFYDGIRRRHTVRDFSSRPVPRTLIETCLAAAGTAPSGANHQPWHFSVIGSAAMKARIRTAAEEEERAFYDGRAGAEWLAACWSVAQPDTAKPSTTAAAANEIFMENPRSLLNDAPVASS